MTAVQRVAVSTFATLLAIVSGGCGAGNSVTAARHAPSQPSPTAAASSRVGSGPTPSPSTTPSRFTQGAHAVTQGGTDGGRTTGPTPEPFSQKIELAASVRVAKACVRPGSTETIFVTTVGSAAVIYQAVYSDGLGGARKPYGGGYGGNAGGKADKSGHYSSTWTVTTDAPSGPGYIDVVVGLNGKWGRATPKFAVAGRNGKCS
jgi:hypothetical protein